MSMRTETVLSIVKKADVDKINGLLTAIKESKTSSEFQEEEILNLSEENFFNFKIWLIEESKNFIAPNMIFTDDCLVVFEKIINSFKNSENSLKTLMNNLIEISEKITQISDDGFNKWAGEETEMINTDYNFAEAALWAVYSIILLINNRIGGAFNYSLKAAEHITNLYPSNPIRQKAKKDHAIKMINQLRG